MLSQVSPRITRWPTPPGGPPTYTTSRDANCSNDSDEAGFGWWRDAGDDPAPQYTGPAEIDGCPIKPGTDCLGDLTNVDLSYADLSGARIGGMEGTTWRNVNLTGANLTNAEIRGPGTLSWGEGVNLTGVNFTGANLWCIWSGGVEMPNANLTNAQLTEVDLYQANLDGTDFTGATLQGVSFDEASMEGANTNWASAEGTLMPDGAWADGSRFGPVMAMDFCQ